MSDMQGSDPGALSHSPLLFSIVGFTFRVFVLISLWGGVPRFNCCATVFHLGETPIQEHVR